MSVIRSMLKQICVYWPALGPDMHGEQTYDAPVELRCRWEDVTEEFLDKQGNRQLSNAKVYVESDVVLNGVLWLSPFLYGKTVLPGTAINELTSETVPFDNAGAWAIRKYEKLPDLKAREFLRTAWL